MTVDVVTTHIEGGTVADAVEPVSRRIEDSNKVIRHKDDIRGTTVWLDEVACLEFPTLCCHLYFIPYWRGGEEKSTTGI